MCPGGGWALLDHASPGGLWCGVRRPVTRRGPWCGWLPLGRCSVGVIPGPPSALGRRSPALALALVLLGGAGRGRDPTAACPHFAPAGLAAVDIWLNIESVAPPSRGGPGPRGLAPGGLGASGLPRGGGGGWAFGVGVAWGRVDGWWGGVCAVCGGAAAPDALVLSLGAFVGMGWCLLGFWVYVWVLWPWQPWGGGGLRVPQWLCGGPWPRSPGVWAATWVFGDHLTRMCV